jgi:hypothetical protein
MGAVARVVVAALLMLLGLAHALPGSRIADAAVAWVIGVSPGHPLAVALATFLWALATGGLVGGGLGLLGAQPLRRAWAHIAAAGATASLLLLLSFEREYLIPGALLDLAILAGLGWWGVSRGEPSRRRLGRLQRGAARSSPRSRSSSVEIRSAERIVPEGQRAFRSG